MDDLEAEYNNYWETKRFYEELDRYNWGIDEVLSSHYDSSSPEGSHENVASSSPTAKNIVMERKRRTKLNESLYALRSVVPTITKMDKTSIIKDAIDYIQSLQEEEKRLKTQIAELESFKDGQASSGDITRDDQNITKREKNRTRSPGEPSIDVMELRVCEVGDRTLVVSITCHKKRDTMVNVCELFESLKLEVRIISASLTSVGGCLLHTLFVEAEEMNTDQLREKMETAIAEYNAGSS